MSSSIDSPKVFISYSWKPVLNKEKTLRLAERLESEGVNVIIDVWNLAEGHDKYQFMEQMVNDETVKRVLLICNKEYTEKANKRDGGVGIESLIISDEIYNQAIQNKFIPIIFERNDAGKEYVPTFVNSRIYIDLSNEESFEEEYEKLMRNIFDRPANKRPPRGNPPAYLFQEESTYLRTSNKVTVLKNALLNAKPNFQIFVDDYYSTFLDALNDFAISIDNEDAEIPVDELVFRKIEEMKVLQDDFIDFFETLLKYSTNVDIEKLLAFLEKLLLFFKNKNDEKNYTRNAQYTVDHYKFFLFEMFLYLTTISIEFEKFALLRDIFHSTFILFGERYSTAENYSFVQFRQYVESLDKIRNERLQLRRVSVTADLIKARSETGKYSFEKLKESDLLLHYVSLMLDRSIGRRNDWFPITSAYDTYNIRLIDKMASRRYFEKVKTLFNADTKEQLEAKVQEASNDERSGYRRHEFNIPYLSRIFDFEKIGSLN